MRIELCAIAPTNWEIKSVADICQRITSGGTPSRREPAYYDGGVWPWVKTQELQDCWIDDTEEHITEEAITASSAKMLPANTILLAMYGATVGQLGILRRPMTCNQACCALIADPDKADFRFLYFQLLQIRSELKSLATGAAQQNLSGAVIKSLRLPFPPLAEQRAIAHILGTLDDKIELNRKQNETLEAMARTLFQAWFVDFEPVRAKMEGRWQRGQSLPGIPAHLYDLFPDRLVDSELGEIPEGWEHKTMSSVSDVGIGKTPPRKESHWFSENPHDVQWVSIRDMGSYGVYTNVTSEFVTEEAVRKFNIRLVPANTVIMSFKLTLGRVSITERELTTNEAIAHFKLSHDSKINPEYLYLHLKQFDFSTLSSTSSIADAVNSKTVRDMRVLIADAKIMQAFTKLVAPWFESVKKTEIQSRVLIQLRDTLLPKLILGELRIEDAEAFLAEHGL